MFASILQTIIRLVALSIYQVWLIAGPCGIAIGTVPNATYRSSANIPFLIDGDFSADSVVFIVFGGNVQPAEINVAKAIKVNVMRHMVFPESKP